MKIKLVCFLMLVMFASSHAVSAMQFSWPVIIGRVLTKDGKNFSADNAYPSSKSNLYYDFGRDKNHLIRVSVEKQNTKFGDPQDATNAVSIGIGSWLDIMEITGEKDKHVYLLAKESSDGSKEITIIGKTDSGKFVQYAGNKTFENYRNHSIFGPLTGNVKVTVEQDTIYIRGNSTTESYQFELKWDDEAQWFGIDYHQS